MSRHDFCITIRNTTREQAEKIAEAVVRHIYEDDAFIDSQLPVIPDHLNTITWDYQRPFDAGLEFDLTSR